MNTNSCPNTNSCSAVIEIRVDHSTCVVATWVLKLQDRCSNMVLWNFTFQMYQSFGDDVVLYQSFWKTQLCVATVGRSHIVVVVVIVVGTTWWCGVETSIDRSIGMSYNNSRNVPIFSEELTLCSTLTTRSATRHNIFDQSRVGWML